MHLHRIIVVASPHQLGAGCEAVAATLAHALGEGRASVLLFWFSFRNKFWNSIVNLVIDCAVSGCSGNISLHLSCLPRDLS